MNDDVFEKIVDEYSNKLYGYLFKLLLNKEDVEDIIQNVFTSFYAKMPSINPNKYTSYLFRMAHNKAINHLKKEKRYVPYNEFKHSEPTQTSDYGEIESKKLEILEAMKKLKPKEIFALELQFYQRKSYKEIAQVMDSTPNAIDSLLFRAKKKLRQILQDK